MPQHQLTLENLKHFELGKVDVAFQKLLDAAVRDCLNRSGCKKPREVLLQFKVTPVLGEGGQCESANVQAVLKSKMPAQQTREVDCSVRTNGALVFHTLFEDDSDAPLLDAE